MFLERGVFSSLIVEEGAAVLDLCCGDGYVPRHFLSQRASRVVAVDFDSDAIRFARRANAAENIEYSICDIRRDFPLDSFDAVTWNAAIEHFTLPEIDDILNNIKHGLRRGGGLAGYTIRKKEGVHYLDHHEHEFADKEELGATLRRHFAYAPVFETTSPSRINLYFYASDRPERIPFNFANDKFVSLSA